MPPHGGHHGGHHGGGGHHHHHHGGGGGGFTNWGPGWGPGWYDAGPAYSELIVTNPCPDVVDPVIGIDGKRYLNACKANQAGVAVRSKAAPTVLKDYVTTGDFDMQSVFWGPVGTAARLAMIYHGYKRNNSVLWGLLWGLTGLLGVPFALAQGFAKPKARKNPARMRRYRRRR